MAKHAYRAIAEEGTAVVIHLMNTFNYPNGGTWQIKADGHTGLTLWERHFFDQETSEQAHVQAIQQCNKDELMVEEDDFDFIEDEDVRKGVKSGR